MLAAFLDSITAPSLSNVSLIITDPLSVIPVN